MRRWRSTTSNCSRYNPAKKFDNHPLKRWAKDEKTLHAALQPLTALEVLQQQQQLVLLGDPGSGKSTLINHLAYRLAGGLLGEDVDWQSTLENRFAQPLLPLRLVLRRWSGQLKATQQAGSELVYQALASQCNQHDRQKLLTRLESRESLILFDGLDEVPVANEDEAFDRRKLIVESVAALRIEHPNCRILVTCRVKPYEQPAYQLPEFPVFRLAKLDQTRINRFLHLWYDEMIRVEANEEDRYRLARQQLLTALPRRSDLSEMAGTPLLLTMLARVNARHQLPENRAELYHECVEQLLWEWERAKQEPSRDADGKPEAATGAHSLLDLLREIEPGRGRSDVERVLWQVTFAAHQRSGKRTADLPAKTVEEQLAKIHPKPHEGKAWASRVVALMQERGGLLVENEPGVFTFPHRSFQEYLAARWLLTQPNRARHVAELASSDSWREVILLACGYQTFHGDHDDVLSMIGGLTTGNSARNNADWLRLLVAGQALLEFDPERAAAIPQGSDLKQKLPRLLTKVMQNSRVPAAQRLEAGLLAADLGELLPDLDEMMPIVAKDKFGYDFAIGKYPVTNALYKQFIDAGGYEQSQPWWSKQAIREILQHNKKQWPTSPLLWHNLNYNRTTQPVIAISWHEANAYCRWLTILWRIEKRISETQKVDLPSETEWLWVAGGVQESQYPWQGNFDPSRCNSKESNLSQTSPVHMYPTGKTPSGVWDLAGNVWEWMNQGKQVGQAWIRGGSWGSGKDRVGSTARLGNSCGGDWADVGFRCVVVPISR